MQGAGHATTETDEFDRQSLRTARCRKWLAAAVLQRPFAAASAAPQGSKPALQTVLVPGTGLEPVSLSAADFKSAMFTNFITRAKRGLYRARAAERTHIRMPAQCPEAQGTGAATNFAVSCAPWFAIAANKHADGAKPRIGLPFFGQASTGTRR